MFSGLPPGGRRGRLHLVPRPLPGGDPRDPGGRQNHVPVRGCLGQLPSQLSPPQQGHPLRGDHIHHHIGLPRGT